MKILIVSDTHCDTSRMDYLLESVDYDIAIHLGDSEIPEYEIKKRFDYYISGNNDFFIKDEVNIIIQNKKIMILHGHTLGISVMNYTRKTHSIIENNNDIDILLYGHTHIPYIKKYDNKFIMCPGSLTKSRLGNETYGMLTINDGVVEGQIIEF